MRASFRFGRRSFSHPSHARFQRPTPARVDRCADGGQTDTDGRRTQSAGLQRHTPSADCGFREAGSRILEEPADKLIEGHVVHSPRRSRTHTIENECLQTSPLAQRLRWNQLIHSDDPGQVPLGSGLDGLAPECRHPNAMWDTNEAGCSSNLACVITCVYVRRFRLFG